MASLRARRSGSSQAAEAREEIDAGESSNRPRKASNSAGGQWIGWLALVAVLGTVVYYQSFWLPPPLSAEQAGRLGFSEERALSHLKVLTSFGPKPVGSQSLEHALEVELFSYFFLFFWFSYWFSFVLLQYIVNVVKDVQRKTNPSVYIEIDQFHSKPGFNQLQGGLFRGKTLAYADLRHILVRVSSKLVPEADENAILVSSHVDTVYTSDGGGDDGSSVSVMLELIRALSNVAQTFKHSVVFLFNTGEEEGLNGAHSFVTQHPWSTSVRTAIDLEAMGAGGKSHIFQAPDSSLLDVFAKVAKYPSAQIGAQDVFHSGFIKSATDFQIYTELSGLSGLDFAYMENGAVYHTRNDALRLVRPGSLQHLGDNLLPLLKEVARSSDLPHFKTLNNSRAYDVVYFDIMGRTMLTVSKPLAGSLYVSTLIQAVLLLAGSFIRAPAFSFRAMAYGILALALTWFFALATALSMAVLVTYVTAASVPYIAYPMLTIGLFAAPALFGAVLGHSVGQRLLYRYLVHCQARSPLADAERTMFKSCFLQWLFVLALATWAGAGSSYIPFTWLVAPAVAYGIFESSFGDRPPRTLSMWTLILGLTLPVALSAGLFTSLPSALVGNLVRIQGNPGSLPHWLANVVMAITMCLITCLSSTYVLAYIHRGRLRRTLLTLTAVVTLASLGIVSCSLLPAFTKDIGKGTYVVHVIDVEQQSCFLSVSFSTAGAFTSEVQPLVENGFTCGAADGPDFVTFTVKKGCTKPLQLDEKLWQERPMLHVERDTMSNGRRSTTVLLDTKSSKRWVLSIDTTKIEAFGMDIISGESAAGSLIPKGNISGVNDRHVLQFSSGRHGPSKFRMELVWLEQEQNNLGSDEQLTVLKLRTDLTNLTSDAARTLRLLPEWCVLFGKSTSPYNLAYTSKLQLKAHV